MGGPGGATAFGGPRPAPPLDMAGGGGPPPGPLLLLEVSMGVAADAGGITDADILGWR